MTGHLPPDGLPVALKDADIVVIPAGVPRKPGMVSHGDYSSHSLPVFLLAQRWAMEMGQENAGDPWCTIPSLTIPGLPTSSLSVMFHLDQTRDDLFKVRQVQGSLLFCSCVDEGADQCLLSFVISLCFHPLDLHLVIVRSMPAVRVLSDLPYSRKLPCVDEPFNHMLTRPWVDD